MGYVSLQEGSLKHPKSNNNGTKAELTKKTTWILTFQGILGLILALQPFGWLVNVIIFWKQNDLVNVGFDGYKAPA